MVRVLLAKDEAEADALKATAEGLTLIITRVPCRPPVASHNLDIIGPIPDEWLDWSAVTDDQLARLEVWRSRPVDASLVSVAFSPYLWFGQHGRDPMLALFRRAERAEALAAIAQQLVKKGMGFAEQQGRADALVNGLEGVELDYAAANAILAENQRQEAARLADLTQRAHAEQAPPADAPPGQPGGKVKSILDDMIGEALALVWPSE